MNPIQKAALARMAPSKKSDNSSGPDKQPLPPHQTKESFPKKKATKDGWK